MGYLERQPDGAIRVTGGASTGATGAAGPKGDKGDTGATGATGPAGPAGTSDSPVGSIMAFAGASPPPGWYVCDGSAISRAANADLFAVCGTAFGAGDGSVTFNLPNLKGRTVAGVDATQVEFASRGTTAGAKTVTLSVANLPPHSHTIAHTHDITHSHTSKSSGTAGGSTLAFTRSANTSVTDGGGMVSNFTGDTGASSAASSGNGSGTSSPVSTLQPVLAMIWIVRATPSISSADIDLTYQGIDFIDNFNSEFGVGYTGADEEFGRPGFPTTIPAGWSAINGTGLTYKERYGAGVMTYPGPAVAGDQYRMYVRPMPGVPTDWTAYGKFSFAGPFQFINTFGLILRNSASGKFFHMSRFVNAGAIEIATWDSPTVINTALVSNYAIGDFMDEAIFRVRKTGTNYTFSASLDKGLTWHVIGTYAIAGFTVDQIGFGGNVTTVGTTPFETACHYLRVR